MAKEPNKVEVQTGVRYPNGDEHWSNTDRFLYEGIQKNFQEEFESDCKRINVTPTKLVFICRTATTTYTETETLV